MSRVRICPPTHCVTKGDRQDCNTDFFSPSKRMKGSNACGAFMTQTGSGSGTGSGRTRTGQLGEERRRADWDQGERLGGERQCCRRRDSEKQPFSSSGACCEHLSPHQSQQAQRRPWRPCTGDTSLPLFALCDVDTGSSTRLSRRAL